MSKITDKIKEKIGAVDNLSKFKKFTKLRSYIEYDHKVEIKLMGQVKIMTYVNLGLLLSVGI